MIILEITIIIKLFNVVSSNFIASSNFLEPCHSKNNIDQPATDVAIAADMNPILETKPIAIIAFINIAIKAYLNGVFVSSLAK